MNEYNYVAPDGNGGFIVVIDGVDKGHYPSQPAAEQAYNSFMNPAAGGGSTGGSTGGGGSSQYDPFFSQYYNSMGDTNQQYFDLEKDKFGWQKEQDAAARALQEKQLYASIAQALLSGATSLRGPANWLDFSTFTNGGKNIFQQLTGNQAAPAFAAPTGYSAPMTMQDILNSLGLGNGGSAATGGGSVGGGNSGAGGTYTPPGANGTGIFSQPPASQNPAPQNIVPNIFTKGSNSVPLPHQINPAVWDSLSTTAKQMILASAEKGNTPSGAWDAGDFLAQLNAARPQGQAPKRVSYNFGGMKSLF